MNGKKTPHKMVDQLNKPTTKRADFSSNEKRSMDPEIIQKTIEVDLLDDTSSLFDILADCDDDLLHDSDDVLDLHHGSNISANLKNSVSLHNGVHKYSKFPNGGVGNSGIQKTLEVNLLSDDVTLSSLSKEMEILNDLTGNENKKTNHTSAPTKNKLSNPPLAPSRFFATWEEKSTQNKFASTIEVSVVSDNNFFSDITGDVNTGGLFVQTYDIRELGSELEIKIKLPWMEQSKVVNCIVEWVRHPDGMGERYKPGMGLKLIDLSTELKTAIEAHARKNAPLFIEY
jgi:Tfp pilus assembly protein PilZ